MRFYIILIVAILSGCATQYQRMGSTGGYTETRLDDHIFKVSFSGNGFTNRETVSDYLLLRNAELTLNNGYKFFVIADSNNHTSISSYTTPTQTYSTGSIQNYGNYSYGSIRTTTTGGQTYNISKPRASNTIFCFHERPENILTYNAEYIYKTIIEKYKLDYKPAPKSISSSVIEHQIRNTMY